MRRLARLAGAAGTTFGMALSAAAGGSPEHALLIIDPLSPESLYVGNYYYNARGLLPNAVLYLDPDAPNYASWVAGVQPGFLGEQVQRGIRDHVDYAIVTPGNSFYVSAPGLLTDACSPVNRFSMSGVFTVAQNSDEVLAGGLMSTVANGFFGSTAQYFDSELKYRFGSVNTSAMARGYYIGAMLGYTGTRGNTVAEVLAMIDRSVAVEGTRPGGTFYFMNNTADPARNVRATQYNAVINAMTVAGHSATQINGTLPIGRHDALGIMTGFSTGAIEDGDYTLLPGSFADHLTSYAATFDNGSQTKMSRWIAKGASATSGTVEEPCNSTAKFPHARIHSLYADGMGLGEAFFRSHQGTPFQTLFLGDPLTRAHTHVPTVSVTGIPGSGVVSGVVTLVPSGSTTAPGVSIQFFELYVDGVKSGTALPGQTLTLDTRTLDEGWHDVRVLAYDSSAIRSVGRWVRDIRVANLGRQLNLAATPSMGNLTTAYSIDVDVIGAGIGEVRLLHNGRVVGSRSGEGPIVVRGRQLGSGPVWLRAEAVTGNGATIRSAPIRIDVGTTAPSPGGVTPVAFGYTRVVDADSPFVLELPAAYTDALSSATYEVVTPPGGSTITGGGGAALVLTPDGNPCGYDQVVFKVTTPSGTSNNGVITLIYRDPTPCPADVNFDCTVDILDILAYLDAFGGCDGNNAPCGVGGVDADYNGDGVIDILDLLTYLDDFGSGCV